MIARKTWLERYVDKLREQRAQQKELLKLFTDPWPKANPERTKKHGDPLREKIV